MPLDTENKRASAIGVGKHYYCLLLPEPDAGAIGKADRAHLTGLYVGILPSLNLDTREKRASAIGVGKKWVTVFPNPDGLALTVFDRRQAAGVYRAEPVGGGIAGIALVITTSVGNITTQIPLNGVAISVVSASGNVAGQIDISGSALITALTSAQLTTEIRLAAAAQAQVSTPGTGLLNRAPIASAVPTLEFTQGVVANIPVDIYGSDPDNDPLTVLLSQGPQGLKAGITYNQALKRLEYAGTSHGLADGSGTNVGTNDHRLVFDDGVGLGAFARSDTIIGNATLTAVIPLSAIAQAQASASGTLTIPADLLGAALIQAVGSGQLTTAIQLVGAAAAVVSSSGSLGTTIPLAGVAANVVTAAAELRLQIEIAATALIQAAVQGGLTTQIFLSGFAQMGGATGAQVSGGFGAALGGAAKAGATARVKLKTAKAKNTRLTVH